MVFIIQLYKVNWQCIFIFKLNFILFIKYLQATSLTIFIYDFIVLMSSLYREDNKYSYVYLIGIVFIYKGNDFWERVN
jgi:hypothetical protein